MYAFVGLIMLVGIVKKNRSDDRFAIEAQRKEGNPPPRLSTRPPDRFRAVMMTTVRALMGSSADRRLSFSARAGTAPSARTAVVERIGVSQFLTLYITPRDLPLLERFQELAHRRETQVTKLRAATRRSLRRSRRGPPSAATG